MSPRVRQARIADMVRTRGTVTVEALARAFQASHETIRRDLTALSEAGVVQKVHGGAKVPSRREEGPFRDRMTQHEPAKREIAAKLARLIEPGETLLIDTGSTTLLCAQDLARIDRLTVVTNSTRIAATIADGGRASGVFLVGGAYDGDNRETVGPMAVRQLAAFHADRAILGAAALNARAGVADINVNEAHIAQAMVDLADSVVVVADSSKFDRHAAFTVCGFGQVDHLVCERAPDGTLAEALAASGVHVQ
ncbi:DeoR/GlpR family DNA-binding transcription regulator [Roseospira navarrensis]|uniref:DeoR family transcriptional regulator n=1 Tax=Roseospira navarrensis TaxID=140058 RepID=A0A7X1ZBZ3_9PROT|nr:DeoR/GlpR family DNA-binding transcription regulator [Roseospira navarrensis]MQX35756.1 DeoR family transcriptional regulator [Roseospira navarrensis]